ncbi:MAG TPA: maleylpyruvate isomerase family mycothiol-dependent enzyme [Acidimicrobiales bacterium]|nr:maleylpyruvate isomerase family mycothiol-dependent enzyme [Acidimicrobiales bacterium]
MGLPRNEVLAGTAAELAGFEDLIRPLSADEWNRPTRCAGWVTGDVAAHVTGTVADIATGRLSELAAPDAPARQVAERRGRSPREVADELHETTKIVIDIGTGFDDAAWAGPAPAGIPGTLGEGVEAIWYDAYVHAEDIRSALGRDPEPGPGVRVSVCHLADLLTRRGWGPAVLALDGLEEVPVSGGGGRRVVGDPLTFIRVATGRQAATDMGLDDDVNVYA